MVEAGGARALAKVQARLGLPVTAERFVFSGAQQAGVERLRIGPADAPLLTARRVEADISKETQWTTSPWPSALRVDEVVVHIESDGTLEGAAKAVRRLVEQRQRRTGGVDGGGGPRRPLPAVTVRDVRVIDHGGALRIEDAELTFANGAFKGTARLIEPPLGKCTLVGDRERVEADCAEAITVPLPGGVQIIATGARFERGDAPQITLPQVRLAAADPSSQLGLLVNGLSADLTLELTKDAEGRRPVRARFSLPGGGKVVARGTADREQISVAAEVNNLSLDPIHRSIRGALSGKVSAQVDVQARTMVVDGDIQLTRFHVTHRAIADGPIGPFTFGLKGILNVAVPTRDPKRIKAQVTDGQMRVGDLTVHLTGAVDNTGEALKLSANARLDPLDAGIVAHAIPPGLLANLQPLRAAGLFGFDAKVAIDMANLKDTVLEANLTTTRLKLVEWNDRISFRRLRRQFYTRFEMPDGEIIVRKTGPQSGRWTPLESVAPLLPAAIMAQEDGGFMRHKGVSMLHLRGSLIRNLERGRFARGGSTMTMQLARNLFLNRRKTLSRKLEELILTWQLEQRFTKRELLALYLNVVEFGHGVFGVGDAARHYFHKAPSQLNPTEVAFLTRLLPAPRLYGKQFERNRITNRYGARMKRLLRRLVKQGKLSQAAYEQADPQRLWTGAGEDSLPPDQEDAPPGEGELEIPDDW